MDYTTTYGAEYGSADEVTATYDEVRHIIALVEQRKIDVIAAGENIFDGTSTVGNHSSLELNPFHQIQFLSQSLAEFNGVFDPVKHRKLYAFVQLCRLGEHNQELSEEGTCIGVKALPSSSGELEIKTVVYQPVKLPSALPFTDVNGTHWALFTEHITYSNGRRNAKDCESIHLKWLPIGLDGYPCNTVIESADFYTDADMRIVRTHPKHIKTSSDDFLVRTPVFRKLASATSRATGKDIVKDQVTSTVIANIQKRLIEFATKKWGFDHVEEEFSIFGGVDSREIDHKLVNELYNEFKPRIIVMDPTSGTRYSIITNAIEVRETGQTYYLAIISEGNKVRLQMVDSSVLYGKQIDSFFLFDGEQNQIKSVETPAKDKEVQRYNPSNEQSAVELAEKGIELAKRVFEKWESGELRPSIVRYDVFSALPWSLRHKPLKLGQVLLEIERYHAESEQPLFDSKGNRYTIIENLESVQFEGKWTIALVDEVMPRDAKHPAPYQKISISLVNLSSPLITFRYSDEV